MARAPRASVSKTSGQGVSRLSYQKGRSLGKSADAPSVKFSSGGGGSSSREYSKIGGKSEVKPSFNVDYGSTFDPRNLDETNQMFQGKPKHSNLSPGKGKKLK